jgi:hypothetical protein
MGESLPAAEEARREVIHPLLSAARFSPSPERLVRFGEILLFRQPARAVRRQRNPRPETDNGSICTTVRRRIRGQLRRYSGGSGGARTRNLCRDRASNKCNISSLRSFSRLFGPTFDLLLAYIRPLSSSKFSAKPFLSRRQGAPRPARLGRRAAKRGPKFYGSRNGLWRVRDFGLKREGIFASGGNLPGRRPGSGDGASRALRQRVGRGLLEGA